MLVLAAAFMLTILAYLVVESDAPREGISPSAASSSSMVAALTRETRRSDRWR